MNPFLPKRGQNNAKAIQALGSITAMAKKNLDQAASRYRTNTTKHWAHGRHVTKVCVYSVLPYSLPDGIEHKPQRYLLGLKSRKTRLPNQVTVDNI